MNEWLLTPFVGGLLMTLVLALAGVGLFLRGSVWQALALSQWAATGGVLAAIAHWPILPPALLLGAAAMGLLQWGRDPERLPLALFLGALALTTLAAANFSQAALAAAAWIEGQLYFLDRTQLAAAAGLTALSLAFGPALCRYWLQAQLAPDVGARPPPHHAGWVLAWLVAAITLGSQTLGLPAALATLLLPPWGAAFLAHSFRGFLLWTLLLALTGYLLAWTLSLALDQPFAPMLVLIALTLAGGARLGAVLRG
jgi:ABC-type Mn2+/Zn2+ transport system permease subunit